MGDKTIPVWKNFRDNTWKSVTVQNLFLPKATCFEGSKCLSALAASSLAISLTLGDNQATRYITSKASRATIRPFVKPPCPIPLGKKKIICDSDTSRRNATKSRWVLVRPPPTCIRSHTVHSVCLYFQDCILMRSHCLALSPQSFNASYIPLPLALSDRFRSFHLCVCLSIFLCGWFSPVMGLGRLCSSHCCNVHVLQISPSSGEKKKKTLPPHRGHGVMQPS